MKRSKIICSLLSLLTVFVSMLSFASSPNFKSVERKIRQVEGEISARIGVTILDTQGNTKWDYKGNERVPLTSTFKTIACAKLLRDAEHGELLLTDSVTVVSKLLQAYSPVTKDLLGRKISFKEACSAAMLTSDNTAANIVLEAIGGPSELTQFIRSIGDNVTRLDRSEPELNEGKPGDIRDTTTPTAIAETISELLYGTTLSKTSQLQLKSWMVNNQVTENLLRSVLPVGWEIADRSGAGGYGSRSITAVVWSQTHAPKIISIYIAETGASFEQRNESIVKIGKAVFNHYMSETEG